MNPSKQKGKVGELELRDKLRAAGFARAYRSQQFCGTGTADVIVPELPHVFVESKRTERAQSVDVDLWHQRAEADAGPDKFVVVAHRKSRRPWLATLRAEALFELFRRVENRGGLLA